MQSILGYNLGHLFGAAFVTSITVCLFARHVVVLLRKEVYGIKVNTYISWNVYFPWASVPFHLDWVWPHRYQGLLGLDWLQSHA